MGVQKKITILILIVYFTVLTSISIIRHNHFFSQGWDLGLYDQIVWHYSRGEIAYSSLMEKTDLADRFRPILLPVALVYLIVPSAITLLIIQGLVLTLAAVPLYLVAKKKTGSLLFSYGIAGAFLLFVGIQSVFVDDFHEVAFFPLFLAWLFYFLETNNWKWYWICFVLVLSVREYAGFTLASIGGYMLFAKKPLKQSLLTIVLGGLWSWGIINVWLPLMGQKSYKGFLGGEENFSSEVASLITNPVFTIQHLLTPLVKIKTVIVSFASFAFLPLFSFPILIPIAFQFTQRFLDLSHPYRWTPYLHYSTELAVFLAVGSIEGAVNLVNYISRHPEPSDSEGEGSRMDYRSIHGILHCALASFRMTNYTAIAFIIILFVGLEQLLQPVPLKLLTKMDFYKEKPYMNDIREILKTIPSDASLAAQNNLAPHVSSRKQLCMLPKLCNAEYILIDIRPGQDMFNFGGMSKEDVASLSGRLKEEGYKAVEHKGDVYLFKKQL